MSVDVCARLKNVNSDVQEQIDACLKVQNSLIHVTDAVAITSTQLSCLSDVLIYKNN